MINNLEIEKKYVIEMPDADVLRGLDGYTESEIVQIYLRSTPGVTHRIRKRTCGGRVTYTETEKRRVDSMSALESEGEIDGARFDALALEMREGSAPVLKKRITFLYDGQLFEIDIYPQWQRSCIMELELPARDAEIRLPPFIGLIADVTGYREYSNSSMSARFPDELI